MKAHTTDEELEFISRLMDVLKTDPSASDWVKNYKETEEYLIELTTTKDCSVLSNIISALELYLNK